jgi:hypothetical protein
MLGLAEEMSAGVALFFGRSSPEHSAGVFSRVLGQPSADAADAAANCAAYVAQALPPAAPSGDSIESGRGLKSRRKPLVQLDPSCDPLYALAHRCRKASVTVTAACSPLSAVQKSYQGAFSMRSPWSPCAF